MPWVNMEQYLAMGRSKFSQELLAELPMRRLEANAVSFSSAPCISEGRMKHVFFCVFHVVNGPAFPQFLAREIVK